MDERFPGELDTLRADNMRLRRLLKLSEEQARAADPDQPALTGAPTAPVDMRSAPEAKLRFYASLFRCRTDVYALRWESRRDGRSGWMPAINGYWRKGMSRADAPYLTLTADVIAQHLRGDLHVGLYPLGDDDTCWWVAADFDKDSAMLDALAYLKAARAYGIPAALEVSQSGRGAHVWIFFAQATPASAARRIATSLLGEAIQLRGSMSLTSYDRLFPSQDVHTGRGMGNLIAAPLNGTRRQHGTTLFSTRPPSNRSTISGPTCPASPGCLRTRSQHLPGSCPILRSATRYVGCSCPRRRRSCPAPRRSSGRRSRRDYV